MYSPEPVHVLVVDSGSILLYVQAYDSFYALSSGQISMFTHMHVYISYKGQMLIWWTSLYLYRVKAPTEVGSLVIFPPGQPPPTEARASDGFPVRGRARSLRRAQDFELKFLGFLTFKMRTRAGVSDGGGVFFPRKCGISSEKDTPARDTPPPAARFSSVKKQK